MMLELTDKETEMLRQALESFDDELRNLIARTDRKEDRVELHDDEMVARKLLKKMTGNISGMAAQD